MSKKLFTTLCLSVLFASACAVAHADTFYFVTPGGTTLGGHPVNDGATITTNAGGTVTITLHDFQANPTDVGQLLSGFQFTLSNGATVGTLASSSGKEVDIASGGTYTLGSGTVATGWGVNNNVTFAGNGGAGIQLDALGFVGPEHLIVGPAGPGNLYSNGNGSIDGNSPHNPFLYESATFTVDVTGVTQFTKILTTEFSFGTSAGSNVRGALTPEPSSLLLMGTGIIGIAALMRRRVKNVA